MAKIDTTVKKFRKQIKQKVIRSKPNIIKKSTVSKLSKNSPYKPNKYEPKFEAESYKIENLRQNKVKAHQDSTVSMINEDLIVAASQVSKKLSDLPASVIVFLIYTFLTGLWYLIWGYFLSNNFVLSSLFPGRFGIFLNFIFFLGAIFVIYGLMENESWNYIYASSWYIIHILNFVILLIDAIIRNELIFGPTTIPFTISLIIINVLLVVYVFVHRDYFRYNINKKAGHTSPWITFVLVCLVFVLFFGFALDAKLNTIDRQMSMHHVELDSMQNSVLVIEPQLKYCEKQGDYCYLTLKNMIYAQEYSDQIEPYKQAKSDLVCSKIEKYSTRLICNKMQLI